jgi:Pyruvate/2-oxoacid:ferredoxin oxidoreductase gamma subunit
MDSNLRMCGIGFRQAHQHTVEAREKEILLMQRQRGIMRRIMDSKIRVMAQGYNKLLEASKANKAHLQHRMRSLIKSLTDKDLGYMMVAYHGLKQRSRMLGGEGMGTANMKKVQLIKRLTNQSHNQQVMAVNSLVQFLVHEKDLDEARRQKYERQQREKDRILRRIMDSNLRMCGIGFRQAQQHTVEAREKERVLVQKQRGIMRRILDSNTRVMAQGYNKLVEASKDNKIHLQNLMRNLIKSLTDIDLSMKIAAYNGLKQRKLMLDGVGLENKLSEKLKIRLIRKLTDSSYNLQVMAVHGLKEFLQFERELDAEEKADHERKQAEKSRILRRIMDSNLRMSGIAFRQAHQHTQQTREKEILLTQRQRGIIRRILDSNTRLLAQGYNALLSSSKASLTHLRTKLKSIIQSLTSQDTQFKIQAYNALRASHRLLTTSSQALAHKKTSFLRRLTNQGVSLQAMAINKLKDFLRSERTCQAEGLLQGTIKH